MSVTDLTMLQGLVKGDPGAYRDEAMQQHEYYLSQYEIFKMKPSKDIKHFSLLIKFLSQIAPCYPEEFKEFPTQIAELLEQNALILEPELRKTLVRALVLLRNRNLLSPTSLLSLFFKLFRVPDKQLRELLRSHIVSDVQKCNKGKKNNELNRTLQNFMYSMLKDSSSVASRESLGVMIELWRRNVWVDKKTVNVISTGIFNDDLKVMQMVLNFFLTRDGRFDDKKKEADEEPVLSKAEIIRKYGSQHTKKTKKKSRILRTKLADAKKDRQKKLRDEQDDTKQYNHGAMTLLNDPQDYCEKVFHRLKTTKHGYPVKLRLMAFCSRLISSTKLMLDSYYSYVQRYLQPHTQQITQILAIVVCSVHPLVSPDIIQPMMMHIANTFVTDRRPNEVIAIGLNTIREICVRSPLVMTRDLLKDLCMYKKNKDKGVMMASHSLISLFRAIHPELLPKKERGKDADLTSRPREFGAQVVISEIQGTELLEKYGNLISLSSDEEYDEDDEDEEVPAFYEDKGDGSSPKTASWPTELPKFLRTDRFDTSSEESDAWEVVSGDEEETGDAVEAADESGAQTSEADKTEEGAEGESEEEEDDGEQESDGVEVESADEGSDDEEQESGEGVNESEASKSVGNISESGAASDDEDIPQLEPITPDQPRLEKRRILTDNDWRKIRKIQEKLAEEAEKNHKGKKRKLEEYQEDDVEEDDLLGWKKRQKLDHEERIAAVAAVKDSKVDKQAFSKFTRDRKIHSKTNEEKKKTKAFAMVKHKAKRKQARSQNQKKKALNKHIKKKRSQGMSKHF